MEGEPTSTSSSQIITKKLWSILKIVMMMIKKGISKGKLIMDLNMILKWANQLAGKALNGIIINHNSLLTRPSDRNGYFLGPKDYEFSCSNTPVVGPMHAYFTMARHKIKPKMKNESNKDSHKDNYDYQLEDPTTVEAVQRVLEIINNREAIPASGFVSVRNMSRRQLRITDSPFPMKDKESVEEQEEDSKVNKAADDFIRKFYKNLRNQKFLESP